MKHKEGFTLIELLVAILIIGILAAIALPQYQKAVLKSKYTELIFIVDNLASQAEERYLVTGMNIEHTQDIELPGDCAYSGPSANLTQASCKKGKIRLGYGSHTSGKGGPAYLYAELYPYSDVRVWHVKYFQTMGQASERAQGFPGRTACRVLKWDSTDEAHYKTATALCQTLGATLVREDAGGALYLF